MVAGELNEKILSEIKKACGNDTFTSKFLSELIFSEADRSKYSRYMQEYLEAIEKYAAEWGANREV